MTWHWWLHSCMLKEKAAFVMFMGKYVLCIPYKCVVLSCGESLPRLSWPNKFQKSSWLLQKISCLRRILIGQPLLEAQQVKLNLKLHCHSGTIVSSRLVCAHAACGFSRVELVNGLNREQGQSSVYEGLLSRLVRTSPTACDCMFLGSVTSSYSHCCHLLIYSQQLRIFATGRSWAWSIIVSYFYTLLLTSKFRSSSNSYWAYWVCVKYKYIKVEYYELVLIVWTTR